MNEKNNNNIIYLTILSDKMSCICTPEPLNHIYPHRGAELKHNQNNGVALGPYKIKIIFVL